MIIPMVCIDLLLALDQLVMNQQGGDAAIYETAFLDRVYLVEEPFDWVSPTPAFATV